jgi:predicted dinucleotide-binding enzyme
MKIGILGTGQVGRALGTCFTGLGHEVMLGGRSGESGADWAGGQGHHGASGSFAEAADFADLAVIAVQGGVALEVAGAARTGLSGKVLIDVTNPLDFSQGFPPRLIEGLANDHSLGEALQAALSETKVVKALNTMSNMVMVNPGALLNPRRFSSRARMRVRRPRSPRC